VSVAIFYLPNWLLRVFVLADGDAHDFAAFFEVLGELLLICAEIYISYENATRVWVVFETLILGLSVVMCVWL
jgi:hypothetical protein